MYSSKFHPTPRNSYKITLPRRGLQFTTSWRIIDDFGSKVVRKTMEGVNRKGWTSILRGISRIRREFVQTSSLSPNSVDNQEWNARQKFSRIFQSFNCCSNLINYFDALEIGWSFCLAPHILFRMISSLGKFFHPTPTIIFALTLWSRQNHTASASFEALNNSYNSIFVYNDERSVCCSLPSKPENLKTFRLALPDSYCARRKMLAEELQPL